MPDIDRSTIEALRRGEEEAYQIVVDELHGPVYRFLLRMCRDSSAAEDLTQETFLALWRGIDSFRGRSQFKTWVFGIAYRQFLRWKDKRAVQTVPLDEGRDAAETSDPSMLLEETDERRRVRQAVYNLPEIYREAIVLVHLEGLSYREAAEILKIPAGTVKSRVNAALKMLRERLG